MRQALQNARWIGLVLFPLMSGVWSGQCEAGTLVLRGTATVATAASQSNPLPLLVSVGDTFDFQLLIDTVLSPGTPPGFPTTFSAQIGGSDVVDAGLFASIFNDSLLTPRHIAEFIDVDATSSFGDAILLFNRDLFSRNSGHLLLSPSTAFESEMLFVSIVGGQVPSSSTILESSELPTNSITWQSFPQRELALRFDQGAYLGAYITSITVVPEPGALVLVTVAGVALRRRRVGRHITLGSVCLARSLQAVRPAVFVLLGLLGYACDSKCVASPVLLRGAATIATVFDDANFPGVIGPLPFTAHVGDTIPFVLSIQSQTPVPDQPSGHATFRATIGGAQLQHDQLEVVVRNDLGVSILTLAEPGDVDALAILGDRILIQKPHQFAETEFVGTTNVGDAPTFLLELGFLEYVGRNFPEEQQTYPAILNDSSIPQYSGDWQAFTYRELAVRFENGSFIGAYINSINLVPEPSTLPIAACCCIAALKRRFAWFSETRRRSLHVAYDS